MLELSSAASAWVRTSLMSGGLALFGEAGGFFSLPLSFFFLDCLPVCFDLAIVVYMPLLDEK